VGLGAPLTTSLPLPPQTLIVIGALIIIVGGAVAAFTHKIRVERRIYWTSWLLGTPTMALALLDRGPQYVALGLAAGAAAAAVIAYIRTSYIKIGGRIYAYTIRNSWPDPPSDGSPPSPMSPPPPDAYRNFLTAPKYWWTLAILSLAASYAALAIGMSGATLGLTALAAGMLALTGHLDARERFPIARRQHLQLAVIVIASILVFLVPPLAYAMTYWAAGGRSISSHPNEDDAYDA
jgi:hypothetical protein